MALPTPEPGLVICYAYLWHHEHTEGRKEGRKDRPCAIVVSSSNEDGETVVLVVPITHVKPADPHAVRLPAVVKRHLRMDSEPSWIVQSGERVRLARI